MLLNNPGIQKNVKKKKTQSLSILLQGGKKTNKKPSKREQIKLNTKEIIKISRNQ